MKKILFVLLTALLLAACGGNEEKDFGYTSNDFVDLFKSNITGDISAKETNVMEDGTHMIELHPGIYLMLEVDDDNFVTRASVGAKSTAFTISGDKLAYGFQTLLKTVDSSLSPVQQTTVFEQLGIIGMESLIDHTEAYALNDVMYSVQSSIENDMLVLYAEPM